MLLRVLNLMSGHRTDGGGSAFDARQTRRRLAMGVLGAAAVAGVGVGIANSVKNRRRRKMHDAAGDTQECDPPVQTDSRTPGHRVFATRVEIDDEYECDKEESFTRVSEYDDDTQRDEDILSCDRERHKGHCSAQLNIPQHVERHPRFGGAIQKLHDNPVISRSHLRALVSHVDHLIRSYYALETLKTADSRKVAHACADVSYYRTKVMRRVVRLAYATGIPQHAESNRLVDDSVQECLDDIKKGTDDMLHNAHLASMDKFDASVFVQ